MKKVHEIEDEHAPSSDSDVSKASSADMPFDPQKRGTMIFHSRKGGFSGGILGNSSDVDDSSSSSHSDIDESEDAIRRHRSASEIYRSGIAPNIKDVGGVMVKRNHPQLSVSIDDDMINNVTVGLSPGAGSGTVVSTVPPPYMQINSVANMFGQGFAQVNYHHVGMKPKRNLRKRDGDGKQMRTRFIGGGAYDSDSDSSISSPNYKSTPPNHPNHFYTPLSSPPVTSIANKRHRRSRASEEALNLQQKLFENHDHQITLRELANSEASPFNDDGGSQNANIFFTPQQAALPPPPPSPSSEVDNVFYQSNLQNNLINNKKNLLALQVAPDYGNIRLISDSEFEKKMQQAQIREKKRKLRLERVKERMKEGNMDHEAKISPHLDEQNKSYSSNMVSEVSSDDMGDMRLHGLRNCIESSAHSITYNSIVQQINVEKDAERDPLLDELEYLRLELRKVDKKLALMNSAGRVAGERLHQEVSVY